MKYIAQTMTYLKKHWWLPLAVFALPAVAACFLSTPYWEVAFVSAFDDMPYLSAADTFAILFGDSWQYMWPVIIVAALQIFAASIVMSAMDQHFRTGRLSLRSPLKLINISVFPMAIGVIVMCVISIVLRFFLFGLVTLVQVIGETAAMSTGAALTIISIIAVALFVLHVLIITPMLFWAPVMFIYGYKFRDAAAMSFKLISGKHIFRGLFAPMVFCAGLQLLMGFLGPHASIAILVNFIVFLVTNVFVTVYVMLTFYDLSDLERRDIKPHQAALPVFQRGKQDQEQRHKPQKKSASKPERGGEGDDGV